LHNTTLYASLFRYDDEILVNPHAFGEPASANPTLHLRRLDRGTIADHYIDSFARWVSPADLDALDIHPTQWRQLRDFLNGTYPHVD
jgi:hypothetical protein